MKVESIPLVAPPHVSVSEGVADGKPVRYTARVEVKPSIEPKDYRGLEISRKPPEVTDQMVSDELSRLQESMSQLVPVEGRFEAQEGDWAVIDHEGTIDGAPFEGGKAEGVTVKVAPGSISEGNLEALKGKRLDETIEIDEPFAQDHRIEELRGKVAHMKVTLKALKARQLPSLDDALAKEVGIEGIETLDSLRARIRADPREAREAPRRVRGEGRAREGGAREERVRGAARARRARHRRDARGRGRAVRPLGDRHPPARARLRAHASRHARAGPAPGPGRAPARGHRRRGEDRGHGRGSQAEAARIAEELGAPLAKVQQQMRGKDAREALKNRVREDKALALLSSTANIQST